MEGRNANHAGHAIWNCGVRFGKHFPTARSKLCMHPPRSHRNGACRGPVHGVATHGVLVTHFARTGFRLVNSTTHRKALQRTNCKCAERWWCAPFSSAFAPALDAAAKTIFNVRINCETCIISCSRRSCFALYRQRLLKRHGRTHHSSCGEC